MDDYTAFKQALLEAKNIVVLAGAGLSAASGIPTFRGAGGLWRKYNATDLATPDAFERDSALVWQFYEYRRRIVSKAEPNAAHRIIARLCVDPSSVAPNASTFRLVTQNIDDLSTRALPVEALPSAHPLEIHGNICRVRCTLCTATERNTNIPICSALADAVDSNSEELAVLPTIDAKDLPRCTKCDGLLRPDVVWFGESTHRLEEIADIITKECDLLLVVGTSATVLPCGIFPDLVRDAGGKVAVFNMEATYTDRQANYIFHGPCEETLMKALT